ncbi:MAG: extracellular solute-binding protein [Thermomicrobiales bacterium]|nr:extracellular solute-binding protein [Thermomicrobiales bacterium]
MARNNDWFARRSLATAQARLHRRQLLQGAAGAMALPLASRLAPAQAAPFSNLSNPAAVAAAQRVLQETGDSAEAAVAAAQQYSGVTLNYLSEAGLMAEGPKVFSGPKWQELTGITVNVVDKPFPELFPTMVQEHIAGTGALDVLDVVPAWMADVVTQGIVEPLQPYIDKYMNPADLEDFHPVYRNLMNYAGNIYGLFDDGDTFLLYYRRDLFDNPEYQAAFEEQFGRPLAPPATWEEYDEVQGFFTEKGGGEFWGGASQRNPLQVYHWFMIEFRVKGGKFFDEETMDATLDSQAGIDTLNRMLASNKSMPPGVEEWDFTKVFENWMEGRLAMVGGTWPPFGRFSERYGADTVQMEWLPPSQVADNVSYAGLPGGYSSLASAFMLCVSADSANKDAAYLFAQWMNSPTISLERVMLPYTLRDPFRLSHYSSEAYRALWANAGEYLDMLQSQTDTALLDIIMPGSQEYHTAIEQMWGAAQGGTAPEQAAADANAAFNAITDRIGRDAQRTAYQEYLKLGNVYPDTPA